MRCRKVRSCLSAYCHDELSGSFKLAIDEHLADCPACRKEEAVYRSLNKAAGQIDSLKVSENFNNILLNRIANERFAETRTKAHYPKPAPVLTWGRALPAFATVCILVLTAIAVFNPGSDNEFQPFYSDISQLDDSYLTVQPVNNPNMTGKMDKNWSLNHQLARVERMNRISSQLQPANNFNNSGLSLVNSQRNSLVPFAPDYYRVRPIIKIYLTPKTTSVREGTGVY